MTNIRIGLDTAKHVFPLPSAASGRNLFFRPTRSKGTRAPFNAQTEGGLFCDSGRLRSGPPQWLNRRAGACPGLLGQPEHSIARHANHTG
jgi:hypothetical protein